ncbi:[LysW]-L-2-aminoadipate 6-phosphate reductase [bacterium HR33]|nr:[LysW]-L-2-aminoadipate 6-phosphate reductase [bacterium HR33]
MSDQARAAIVGGGGYVGGELLRLLLFHPHVTVSQVTSESRAGQYVHTVHPNLRRVTDLKFVSVRELAPCDILFLALPHGEAARTIDHYATLAERIVDCSADFRLDDPEEYAEWYGAEHPAAPWLERFVYGLPEINRNRLRGARYASGVGCNAAVTILALEPLARAGLLRSAVADVKVGSSEGGAHPTEASHHPERAGAVRSFMPTGHRHEAEIRQALGGGFELSFSVTAVELVRGALVTAHCFLESAVEDRDLWKLYRERYENEPFVRLVRQKTGIYRYPEPKILAGSNYCDIGFEADRRSPSHRVVVVAALDNLMKGAAGTAVQCMNLMMGWEETAGLWFPGLHPI